MILVNDFISIDNYIDNQQHFKANKNICQTLTTTYTVAQW